jgi:hypothetical protein
MSAIFSYITFSKKKAEKALFGIFKPFLRLFLTGSLTVDGAVLKLGRAVLNLGFKSMVG